MCQMAQSFGPGCQGDHVGGISRVTGLRIDFWKRAGNSPETAKQGVFPMIIA